MNDGGDDGRFVTKCEWCGTPVEQPISGRPRLFCSPKHRQSAHQWKARQTVIDVITDAYDVGHDDVDPRIDYVVVQIDRPAYKAGRKLLAHLRAAQRRSREK